ncbi:hypothetical protein CEXT_345221 [Caerostris extrusa]|uniref:Uncharacterized protein n=1 Tax=Caerostris extrusa TaxID=172846 RepID=A0AAV4THI9_CAEEX|nr:hypothetical protein CEXT_345221 [Caerostris extrusa]
MFFLFFMLPNLLTGVIADKEGRASKQKESRRNRKRKSFKQKENDVEYFFEVTVEPGDKNNRNRKEPEAKTGRYGVYSQRSAALQEPRSQILESP